LWLCETAVKVSDPRFVDALKMLAKVAAIYGVDASPVIGEDYVGADRPA
jgi:hypothetical protein